MMRTLTDIQRRTASEASNLPTKRMTSEGEDRGVQEQLKRKKNPARIPSRSEEISDSRSLPAEAGPARPNEAGKSSVRRRAAPTIPGPIAPLAQISAENLWLQGTDANDNRQLGPRDHHRCSVVRRKPAAPPHGAW